MKRITSWKVKTNSVSSVSGLLGFYCKEQKHRVSNRISYQKTKFVDSNFDGRWTWLWKSRCVKIIGLFRSFLTIKNWKKGTELPGFEWNALSTSKNFSTASFVVKITLAVLKSMSMRVALFQFLQRFFSKFRTFRIHTHCTKFSNLLLNSLFEVKTRWWGLWLKK